MPGLALVALVASAVLAGRLGRPGALLLATCSVLWLFADHDMEGPLLWEVTPHHGLVAADLAGVAGLVFAVAVWVRPGRSSPAGPSGSGDARQDAS